MFSIARRRGCKAGISVVAAVGLLGGCSSGDSTVSGPWAAEFEQVYATATNDFVRRIVADGELTLANMREAAARTMECFELVGSDFFIEELGYGDFSVTIKFELGQGLDEVLEEMGEEVYRASINCELEYWNELWSLWELIRLNPEAEDFDGMIAECLIRNDLAAEGFTGRQFREASMSCGLLIEDDPMNPLSPEERQELFEAHWEATRDCRPQLPGPVYLDEGVAWDCQMDPLNN